MESLPVTDRNILKGKRVETGMDCITMRRKVLTNVTEWLELKQLRCIFPGMVYPAKTQQNSFGCASPLEGVLLNIFVLFFVMVA